MADIPVLDWVFLSVLTMSLLLGVWRGVVYELLSLAVWVAAYVGAQTYGSEASELLPLAGAGEKIRLMVGFVAVFIVTIFVGGLIVLLIKRLVAAVGLSAFDRALGAGFGLIRGLLVLMVACVVISLTPFKTSTFWRESIGVMWITQVFKGIEPFLPHEYRKYLT